MVKRIQVFGIFFILVLSGGYSIDLKHIVSYMPDNPGIAVSYGRTQWVSDTEIFSSEVSETRIFDITNRKSSMLFNPMKEIKADIIFKNEEILLLRDLNIDRNKGQEYYIYSLKTKRMYPLDKEGTEQYLADGGKEYSYYTFSMDTVNREKLFSYYKSSVLSTIKQKLWTEDAGDIFNTVFILIDRFSPQDNYENIWLGDMYEDLYLLQVDESGVKTSYKIQNNIGTSGVFLKDGRVLAPYCPVDENPFYRGGEESYLKLAVFNSKGEIEKTLDKEIYVVAGRSKMMSISPDGTKLLVMGYDKDHFNKWDVQINIYEIIYD